MALIEVRNLEKTFDDGKVRTPVLHSLSFDIKQGEFISIMGPSGSGKSTLLHILGFLDKLTTGSYRFDDKSVEDFSDEELAHVRNKKMGFVFQTFNLLPRMTVAENVKLPLLYSGIKESLWDEMSQRAIEAVGLMHRIDYDSSVLSGGERQRVAIARALVNEPNLIFADEPTGNLDSKSGEQVMDIIESLHKKGHTVVLITHETYTAEYASRIIKIRDGRIESDQNVTRRPSARNNFIK